MESVRIEASVEKAVAELGRKPGAGDGAFIDLPLEYFRGEPKAGWPTMIRLTAPPQAEYLRIVAAAASCHGGIFGAPFPGLPGGPDARSNAADGWRPAFPQI
ncbi:MAG: hypothetical protein DME22_05475 [Verrucomicrobia bacterium]|nr:MAG: hypothetical protein DME22_05475 [Verrucomicrobiota bacterium]